MSKDRIIVILILCVTLPIIFSACQSSSMHNVVIVPAETIQSTYTPTNTFSLTPTILPTITNTPSLTNTSYPTTTYTKVSVEWPKYLPCSAYNTSTLKYIKLSIQFPKGWENKTIQKDLIMWGPPKDDRVVIISCELLGLDAKITAEDFLLSPKVLLYEGPFSTAWNYDAYKILFYQSIEKTGLNLYFIIRRDNKTIIVHSSMSTRSSQSEWEGFLDVIAYTIIIY
jgi:hypothetical protein